MRVTVIPRRSQLSPGAIILRGLLLSMFGCVPGCFLFAWLHGGRPISGVVYWLLPGIVLVGYSMKLYRPHLATFSRGLLFGVPNLAMWPTVLMIVIGIRDGRGAWNSVSDIAAFAGFFLVSFVIFLAPCVLVVGLAWLAMRLYAGPIVFQDGTLCPRCAFVLIGAAELVCPECGRPFTFEELGSSLAEFERRRAAIRRPSILPYHRPVVRQSVGRSEST